MKKTVEKMFSQKLINTQFEKQKEFLIQSVLNICENLDKKNSLKIIRCGVVFDDENKSQLVIILYYDDNLQNRTNKIIDYDNFQQMIHEYVKIENINIRLENINQLECIFTVDRYSDKHGGKTISIDDNKINEIYNLIDYIKSNFFITNIDIEPERHYHNCVEVSLYGTDERFEEKKEKVIILHIYADGDNKGRKFFKIDKEDIEHLKNNDYFDYEVNIYLYDNIDTLLLINCFLENFSLFQKTANNPFTMSFQVS